MDLAQVFDGRTTDELCRLIEDGDLSLQGIAERWGVTKRQLQGWIDRNPERALRAKEARQNAADWCDRAAERVLLDLPRDATPGQIAQARELAQHYRWRARVRNPATHGDKIEVNHNITMDASKLTDDQLAAIAATGAGLVIDGVAERVLDETGENAA